MLNSDPYFGLYSRISTIVPTLYSGLSSLHWSLFLLWSPDWSFGLAMLWRTTYSITCFTLHDARCTRPTEERTSDIDFLASQLGTKGHLAIIARQVTSSNQQLPPDGHETIFMPWLSPGLQHQVEPCSPQ